MRNLCQSRSRIITLLNGENQALMLQSGHWMICPLLSGPISILGMATKEEWNGKEAQTGGDHR